MTSSAIAHSNYNRHFTTIYMHMYIYSTFQKKLVIALKHSAVEMPERRLSAARAPLDLR